MRDALDELFGRIRSTLQRDVLDAAARRALWSDVCAYARADADAFSSRCLPYLQGFPHHFHEPLQTLGDLDELERACGLLPHARWAVELGDWEGTGDAICDLLTSPLFAQVDRLDLQSVEVGIGGMDALVNNPHMRNIQWLGLGMTRLGADGVEALTRSPHLTSLSRLGLSFNALGARSVSAICNTSGLSGLTELCLGLERPSPLSLRGSRRMPYHHGLGNYMPRFETADLIELFSAPALQALTHLNLAFTNLGPRDIQALADVEGLPSLEVLDLSYNTLGDEGLEAFARSPYRTQLRELSLIGCQLSAAGVEALASSEHMQTLESLDLSGNAIGVRGIRALARMPHLHTLKLSRARISNEELEALADAFDGRGIEHLELQYNDFDADAALALARAWNPSGMFLGLGYNTLDVGFADAFARTPLASGLSGLNVTSCGLGDDGLLALLRPDVLRGLETLDVEGNGMGTQATRALSSTPEASSLRRLDIANNPIGDDELDVLTSSPHLQGIRSVCLGRTSLSAVGRASLRRSAWWSFIDDASFWDE